jgi:phage/plasmid-associated DNA primase
MTTHEFTEEEAESYARWQSEQDRGDPPYGANGASDGAAKYAWNDGGNAQRLLDAGGRERLLYVAKQLFPFHIWDGNCWLEDREQRVGKWMEQVLRAAYAATWKSGQPRAAQTEEAKFLARSGDDAKVRAALSSASRYVTVVPEALDTHDWYLPCNNGLTYDLATGNVISSLPEHRMTRCVPFPALRGPAPHPKWDE